MQKRNDFGIINKYRTAIMGFAALWIYFYHLWVRIVKTEGLLRFAEQFVKRIGFCGVDIFFFLSGMGLLYAIEKGSVGSFYKRRFSRVYLPFAAMAVIKMTVQGWPLDMFIKNITGFNFFAENIYSFLWFVPAIMVLYLLFPLYHRIFCKVPDKIQFTLVVLIIWWFLSVLVEDTMRRDLYGFTNRLPVFLIGLLIGWSIREREMVFTRLTWVLWMSMCALGVYFAYMTNYREMYLMVPSSNCCVPNLLMSVSGCCLLAKLFSWTERYVGKWVIGFFEFFGKISLEFYCVQEWVGDKIISLLRGHCGAVMMNVITLAGVLVATLLLAGGCRVIRIVLDKASTGMKGHAVS